jgi:hypothetical protein
MNTNVSVHELHELHEFSVFSVSFHSVRNESLGRNGSYLLDATHSYGMPVGGEGGIFYRAIHPYGWGVQSFYQHSVPNGTGDGGGGALFLPTFRP